MAAENRLTDVRVRNATRAKDGPYLRDGGGLRVRLLEPSANHPKGAKLFEYEFKLRDGNGGFGPGTAIGLGTYGKMFTDALGVTRPFTLNDARQARDAARDLVARGIDPREAARLAVAEAADSQRKRLAALDGRRTVAQAFERWHALYLSSHRKDGGSYVKGMFERHILPTIGAIPLDELNSAQAVDVIDSRTTAGTKRTAEAVRALLRQFTGWCSARGWITGRDPMTGVTKSAAGGAAKARQRTLSLDEIVELRDKLPTSKLPERLGHALWLILATGVRVGEISNAKAADFDTVGQTWLIPQTKNGAPHLVHLSDFALRHVERLLELRGKSQWLLPARAPSTNPDADEPVDDSRPVSDKVIAKAVGDRQRTVALKGRSKAVATLLLARGRWVPHDLRRSLATHLRETLRVSSDVVERCLNHKPQGIVAVYQTGALLTERKAAFEAWGAELEKLMKADGSNVVSLASRKAAA